ncbi:glycosyltransferase [Chloroflexota bacterium]
MSHSLMVDIVMPDYNEENIIKVLVERIARALTGRDTEVIVIDDDSPDGTAQVTAGLATSSSSY